MLNHAGNSYVTRQIQLCQTEDSYIILTCICSAYLLDRVRDPTSPLPSKVNRGAILKRNEESRNSVFHFILLCFYLKCHITHIKCLFGRLYLPEYQPLGDTKALARYITLCLRHRVT